jgi:hypothetical protein
MRDRAQRGSDTIFICYRSTDSCGYAALLYLELARAVGPQRLFLAGESISAGARFDVEIVDGVHRAAVMLTVMGPRWLDARGADGRRLIDDPDDWIRRELTIAFARGCRVIPILTDAANLPSGADLPAEISALSTSSYRRLSHRDIRWNLARIIADLTPRRSPLARPLLPRRPPRVA